MLLPPPTSTFVNRNDLIAYCRNFTTAEGYKLIIGDSKVNSYVYLNCDMGGAYRNRYGLNDETRQRITASRKTGCKFSLYCTLQNGEWSFVVRNGEHNHEATDLRGHPFHRRLSVDDD